MGTFYVGMATDCFFLSVRLRDIVSKELKTMSGVEWEVPGLTVICQWWRAIFAVSRIFQSTRFIRLGLSE